MALREKHAWRRRLGLRGSLWYFEEPKKPKPPSVFNQPAAWSAIVAAISAVLTALFAYNNYLLTKRSYLQTHPPRLVAVSAVLGTSGRSCDCRLMVRNDGDTEAVNVEAVLQVYDPVDGAWGLGFIDRIDIAAGRTETLFPERDSFFRPQKDDEIVHVKLVYSDTDSASYNPDLRTHERRTVKFCGAVRGRS